MKTLVIDAIVGVGFGNSMMLAEECVKAGLARHTGNQWNPDWEWRREALEKVDLDKLQTLYASLREEREMNLQRKKQAEALKSKIILTDSVRPTDIHHAH